MFSELSRPESPKSPLPFKDLKHPETGRFPSGGLDIAGGASKDLEETHVSYGWSLVVIVMPD